MKLKSTILLVLMITLPIALLAWLGARLAKNEQTVIQTRFQKILTTRLTDIDGQISDYLDELERSMQELTDRDDFSPESLRAAVRKQPDVTTLFVMDSQNRLVFPSMQSSNRIESNFLVRADQVLIDKDLFFANQVTEGVEPVSDSVESYELLPKNGLQPKPTAMKPTGKRNKTSTRLPSGKPTAVSNSNPQMSNATTRSRRITTNQLAAPQQQTYQQAEPRLQVAFSNIDTNAAAYNSYNPVEVGRTTSSGWISWFWGRGVRLIYWQRRSSGYLVGVEIDRARFLSNIIATLPDTRFGSSNKMDGVDSQIRLVDSSSRTLYQWGQLDVRDDADSFCEIPVTNPLASWRLKYFVPIAQLTAGAGRGIYYNLVTGLTLAAFGLGALGFFAYREYSRDMREAEQRVSFVNQVSHELKTPLTNIRMYADLLDNDLDSLDDDVGDASRGRLEVIQSESQRLSRLIGNVLTFAGQKRKTLQLKKTDAVIDDIIHETLKQFRPSLEQSGIKTTFEASATKPTSVDPDAIEQIIGNLINNVEKYAGDGGQLRIISQQTDTDTVIKIVDNGPGVDVSMRKKIFQPFARASDSLHRAAGTGIGLSIARDLARLHGGDLQLLESSSGACFELRLPNSNGQLPTSKTSINGATT